MMDYSSFFPALDSESRVWVYVANTPLSPVVQAELNRTVQEFGANWSSHGRVVVSDFTVMDNQILILSAFVQQGEISGCGIDKSLHVLDQFALRNGFDWVSALSILYRDGEGALVISSRSEFRQLIKSGAVTESTIVLDPSITTLSQLRDGQFEMMAGMCWHAGVFQIPVSMPQ